MLPPYTYKRIFLVIISYIHINIKHTTYTNSYYGRANRVSAQVNELTPFAPTLSEHIVVGASKGDGSVCIYIYIFIYSTVLYGMI